MTHGELVSRAVRWLRGTKQCLWVLSESRAGFVYTESADAIGWDRYGLSHLIEVKVDRQDFNRDKNKSFRTMPSTGMGSFRYYMVPTGLEAHVTENLPASWGLLVVSASRVFVRKEPLMQPRNADVEISLVLHRNPAIDTGVQDAGSQPTGYICSSDGSQEGNDVH
jgi:hypothetical protein